MFKELDKDNLNSYLYIEALSGHFKGLRVFPAIVSALIVLVFEMTFFVFFFSKKFSENLNSIKFAIFNLMLGAVRVLSGVAIFASKYECSNFCSSGDMSLFFF